MKGLVEVEDIEEFRPSGALEMRKAGLEFEKMRRKNCKDIYDQRSEMLVWDKSLI